MLSKDKGNNDLSVESATKTIAILRQSGPYYQCQDTIGRQSLKVRTFLTLSQVRFKLGTLVVKSALEEEPLRVHTGGGIEG